VADSRSGVLGDNGCAVLGIVVIDVNNTFRKSRPKIPDDLGYGLSFVVTGNDNGDSRIHDIPQLEIKTLDVMKDPLICQGCFSIPYPASSANVLFLAKIKESEE